MGYVPRVDVGEGTGKKKKHERLGFKQDRFENYQLKKQGKKVKEKSPKAKKTILLDTQRVKSVRFDTTDREDFLGGFHKRKNERRVGAFVDAKNKIRRENAKMKKEQREEARRQYNQYATVPILPDYSYKIPDFVKEGRQRGEVDANGNYVAEDDEDADVEGDDDDEDGHNHDGESSEDDGEYHGGGVDNETSVFVSSEAAPVQVSCKPLFGSHDDGGGKQLGANTVRATNKGHDFSDLPKEVAKTLINLRQEKKGPSQMKRRVRTRAELDKIRKIQKHCRKGHGKKTKHGKKKNR